uniref:Uncharacterized protein n=1 Tax=Arundo donax TaxID=35708 RepID=A0A0A8ZKL6_ARUDO
MRIRSFFIRPLLINSMKIH